MLRRLLLALARNDRVRGLIMAFPATRNVVERFVAGTTWQEAEPKVRQLIESGLKVTVDILGEDTASPADAERLADDYLGLLDRLAAEGLAGAAEVSVKPSAIGLALPADGPAVALAQARRIAAKAEAVGSTITLDMEGCQLTDATIELAEALRAEHPSVGCVLQAGLRRSQADCGRLDGPGSRIRLCKGAYDVPADLAYTARREVDLSYVRCLKALVRGEGLPLVATHDPVLIEIAQELASRAGRGLGDLEFQMLYGVRPEEQRRLASMGYSVRVYVPYGPDWYGYFMRRLAERPANVGFFLRSLVGRS
ncbi:MAG: proline dehydrogenase family protein [Propionibacteriaceae bacterium]|jgi:proline dehydrogenase|nr:proline dehydrogenase family protein [Propionibacteriaceae bacterium]